MPWFDQLGTLWSEHHVLISILGVLIAGIAATSLVAWLLRKIIRPIIALVVGAVTTGIGATVTGFIANASDVAGRWMNGG